MSTAAAVLVATIVSAGGCQTARVRQPLTAVAAGNDAHSRTEFWAQLANRPLTSNDDAFHGLLLYLDGADPCADYAGRVRELQSRGMLASGFHQPADEALERGTLAVALVKALKVRGGLTMQLLGATPRYAVRALEYRGVYPPSSPNQALTGGEFVGILQKAEEFQRGNPADAPAALLPDDARHAGGPSVAAAVAKPAPEAEEEVALVFPADGLGFDLRTPKPVTVYLDGARGEEPIGSELHLGTEDRGLPAAAIKDSGEGGVPAAPANPLFLAPDITTPDAAPPAAPSATVPGAKRLNVIVTGVEGELAEVRKGGGDAWAPAKRGMVLHEEAEFRTGAKSAVRFIIPPDQTFCLDSQSSLKVLQAVANGKKVKTEVGLARGRVREDLVKIPPADRAIDAQPVRIEEAGLEHDTVIRSPNSALALRGTKVSLFEQPGFAPEAISLTGRAVYTNTRGLRVPFGGVGSRAAVQGDQTSAVQQSANRSTSPQATYLARTDFENRELSIVIQRGGFVIGDVVVGNLHLSDFRKLPGALDFVLQWPGGPQQRLNDLNLAVFSPLNTRSAPDFVANPPFTVSLTPGSAKSEQTRASNYPRNSPSGGAISKNSVGPDGLELADWPRNYPAGTYRVVVYNLLDAKPAPAQTVDPVTYTIDVFLNGRKLIKTYTGSVGLLQTSSALLVPVPASAAAVSAKGTPVPAALRRGTSTSSAKTPHPTR